MRLPLCGPPAFFLICLATLLPLIPVSTEPVCNESDGPGEQLPRPRGGDFFAAKGPHDLSGGDTLPVEEWSDADLQELRDWLDNNAHADVRIISNVGNNGALLPVCLPRTDHEIG